MALLRAHAPAAVSNLLGALLCAELIAQHCGAPSMLDIRGKLSSSGEMIPLLYNAPTEYQVFEYFGRWESIFQC